MITSWLKRLLSERLLHRPGVGKERARPTVTGTSSRDWPGHLITEFEQDCRQVACPASFLPNQSHEAFETQEFETWGGGTCAVILPIPQHKAKLPNQFLHLCSKFEGKKKRAPLKALPRLCDT
ncbi:uncharacterized protein UTRI_00144 [Ustilago trichophora]|uniref:Uncharacterized protein n=1 Tax=Ustilago trichophora TaxID=86804 RepID=A0A5C3DQW3_9BASI|nr:uncharacterized protein UTRI_00144 [Ustilago trichophora]